MENRSDEELMEAFGKGDQIAFAELYQRHRDSLYRFFTRQLGGANNARAEELFQDVWYRVVDKREQYLPSAKFTTWLYHMARNLVIDEHRKRMSEQAYSDQLDNDWAQNLNDPEQRNKTAIRHCVSSLAPLQREVFMLKHESGFELTQISDIVDSKPEAVKSRLRYAMEQLRQCLTHKLGVQE